jgi:hypothetical protein
MIPPIDQAGKLVKDGIIEPHSLNLFREIKASQRQPVGK